MEVLHQRYGDIIIKWDDMAGWSIEQIKALVDSHSDVGQRVAVLHELAALLADGSGDIEDQTSVEQISTGAYRVINTIEDSVCSYPEIDNRPDETLHP